MKMSDKRLFERIPVDLSEDLIVLIPTTGNSRKLERSLRSLDYAAEHNNVKLRVILSVNTSNTSSFDFSHEYLFLNLEVQFLGSFKDSAEESTLEAFKLLVLLGDPYVWILGDDDFILPAGLAELIVCVRDSKYKVLFFNSLQCETKGKILKGPFIHAFNSHEVKDFTDFALRCGINYSPTGFGRLVVKFSLVKDLHIWDQLISEGGPIFSYVTYFMYALKGVTLFYVNTPLMIYRQNDYHEGNHDMWKNYAKRRNELEFSPWTSELISQIALLERLEVVSLRDLTFTTIIEREIGYRFPLLVLEQFHEQIRVALSHKNQIPDVSYMDKCVNFICRIAPDFAPIVEQIENVYFSLVNGIGGKALYPEWMRIRENIVQMRLFNPYGGFLVDFRYGHAIYTHIDGYVATRLGPETIGDAYVVLDPKMQDSVMFANTLFELDLRLAEIPKSIASPFPRNVFDWSYAKEPMHATYSENVQLFLNKLFPIWDKLPKAMKALIKAWVARRGIVK
jgi:hypothetical protein